MKLAHLFFDTHMGLGHPGLNKILKSKRVALEEGETAIFINRKRSALKMVVLGGVIVHLRREDQRPIALEAVKYLPYCLEGKKLNYDKALRAALEEKLGVK